MKIGITDEIWNSINDLLINLSWHLWSYSKHEKFERSLSPLSCASDHNLYLLLKITSMSGFFFTWEYDLYLLFICNMVFLFLFFFFLLSLCFPPCLLLNWLSVLNHQAIVSLYSIHIHSCWSGWKVNWNGLWYLTYGMTSGHI